MIRHDVNEAIARELGARQNPDGGWAAAAGAKSNTECTALALLALTTATASAGTDAALRWLLGRQEPAGAWRYDDGGAAPPWPTAIVLLAVRGRSEASAATQRGFGWLLAQRSKPLPLWIRLRELLTGERLVDHDTTLDGWSWAPGTAYWIEPTAWALMALKAEWGAVPRGVRRRIREGEAMVLDRECPAGGWNYGNKRVLEQDLDPYPDTTALALLGLRGRRPSEVERGFQALDRLLDRRASGLALSLGILARRAWGRETTPLPERLAERYESSGFLGETRTLALAVLALAPTLSWLGGGSHA